MIGLGRCRLIAAVGLCQALTCTIGFTQNGPPAMLPTIRLNAGIHNIQAEVARTPVARTAGLMFRQHMGANAGMLFVFERPARQCFWMKNTPLPLSIAFLAEDGIVINMADMMPQTTDSHCSQRPVRFALEMNRGWFAKHGVKAGSKLQGEPFSN